MTAVSAGLLFGLAYLAKTPGLPLSIGFMLALGLVDILLQNGTAFRPVAKQFSIAFVAMLVIVAPWVTTLSIHYGKLTWTDGDTLAIVIQDEDTKAALETLSGPLPESSGNEYRCLNPVAVPTLGQWGDTA